MSPEQITERLDEIIGQIADAHILMNRLKQDMGVNKRGDDIAVVYEDIWKDMRLDALHKDLRSMEHNLVRWSDLYLPEHFERLRTGMVTDAEREALESRFEAEHVWAYVEINQGNNPAIVVPALKLGHFAVTEIYCDGYGPYGAKVTHLPTGAALGAFIDLYKPFIVELSDLGEKANTILTRTMGELFSPLAIKHGLLSKPPNVEHLPPQFERLNDRPVSAGDA